MDLDAYPIKYPIPAMKIAHALLRLHGFTVDEYEPDKHHPLLITFKPPAAMPVARLQRFLQSFEQDLFPNEATVITSWNQAYENAIFFMPSHQDVTPLYSFNTKGGSQLEINLSAFKRGDLERIRLFFSAPLPTNVHKAYDDLSLSLFLYTPNVDFDVISDLLKLSAPFIHDLLISDDPDIEPDSARRGIIMLAAGIKFPLLTRVFIDDGAVAFSEEDEAEILEWVNGPGAPHITQLDILRFSQKFIAKLHKTASQHCVCRVADESFSANYRIERFLERTFKHANPNNIHGIITALEYRTGMAKWQWLIDYKLLKYVGTHARDRTFIERVRDYLTHTHGFVPPQFSSITSQDWNAHRTTLAQELWFKEETGDDQYDATRLLILRDKK
jgi:hypothetical protein